MVASLLDGSRVLRADLATRGPGDVVAVNYHGTPARFVGCLKSHFTLYREHFECLGEDELGDFVTGSHRLKKPGIVISFDDGLRNHAEIAAPLLAAYGLRGWFMLPGAFLDEPAASQDNYFRRRIRGATTAEHPGPALAMTWDMARKLRCQGHVIGSHSWSHAPLGPGVSTAVLDSEIDQAKLQLEERIGHPVRTFAWVRGGVDDYSAPAHCAIARRFDLAFMSMSRVIRRGADPHALHRFNVEASFALPVLRFQISRFNELSFARRRRSVAARIHA